MPCDNDDAGNFGWQRQDLTFVELMYWSLGGELENADGSLVGDITGQIHTLTVFDVEGASTELLVWEQDDSGAADSVVHIFADQAAAADPLVPGEFWYEYTITTDGHEQPFMHGAFVVDDRNTEVGS
jgi:hypothetical protein